MGVSPASPVAYSVAPVAADPKPQPQESTPTPAEPAEEGGSSSYAIPLLILIVIGLVAGHTGVHLLRRHRARQHEAQWRQEEEKWDSVVKQIEMEQGASVPKVERQKI